MKKLLTVIRIGATSIWAIAGILTQSPAGYLSAAASVIFLCAIILEYIFDLNNQVSDNDSILPAPLTGEELDRMGNNLGMKRKTFSLMGAKVKETDGQYRQRMRKMLLGVKGPELG